MDHDPIEYHWAAGTVPPPYHYELDILIHPGSGEVIYWPGYRSTDLEVQHFPFEPDRNSLTELKMILSEISSHSWLQSDPGRVGGPQEWLRFGDRLEIPPDLMEPDSQVAVDVFQRVRELAPDPIWAAIR